MAWFTSIFTEAFARIVNFDESLYEVITLTLYVSLTALLISTIVGLALAAMLATVNHKIRNIPIVIINTLMGFPPVLAGLIVYLLLSRRGSLGALELLFTPTAMIIAQTLLICPIVCGISQTVFRRKWLHYHDFFQSLSVSKPAAMLTIVFESRYDIISAIVTGLGRGLAEVGAVMIVGGNILHHTRTITTSIALETSKGEISLAVSLGIILLAIGVTLNIFLMIINKGEKKQ